MPQVLLGKAHLGGLVDMDALINASIAKMYAKKIEAGDIDADLFKANATIIYEGVK